MAKLGVIERTYLKEQFSNIVLKKGKQHELLGKAFIYPKNASFGSTSPLLLAINSMINPSLRTNSRPFQPVDSHQNYHVECHSSPAVQERHVAGLVPSPQLVPATQASSKKVFCLSADVRVFSADFRVFPADVRMFRGFPRVLGGQICGIDCNSWGQFPR